MTKVEHLQAIKDADRAYYEQDNPVMTDVAYDELRRSYIEQYGANDLNYVPGAPSAAFAPFHHPYPVTSLAKIKMDTEDSEKELTKWRKKLSPIVLEPKYDGLTVVAYPQKDGIFKFVTRGSGTDGETLPNFISFYEESYSGSCSYPIRGEVMLRKQDFAEIQADQKLRGEEPFKNIRNAAAGILRSKERSPYIDKLVYICYDVLGVDWPEVRKLMYIAENTPFKATSHTDTYVIDTPNEYIWKRCRHILDFTGQEYPLDGVVIKTMQDGALAKYGMTGHHPNNAVAVKPEKQVFMTILRNIEFGVGRTKITPVAIFDPVTIDDTEVTRASIHNKDYFDEMQLCKGDTVYVYKSNEIIPQIDSVIHNGGEPFKWPEPEDNSTEQLIRDIMHMASKPVLDIKGLSEKTIRKIVKAYPEAIKKYGHNILFYLDAEDYAVLDGMGEKSAEKIDKQITALRNDGARIPSWMSALCIPGIGAHVGEILEKNFMSFIIFKSYLVDTPKAEKITYLTQIDCIGLETAKILANEAFTNACTALEECVTPIWKYTQKKDTNKNDSDSWITGKNFALTGKMEHPRSYYEEIIRSNGGNVQSSVNSKTDYLIIVDINSDSTKAKKARKLGIKLISPSKID